MGTDRAEQVDLSSKMPEKRQELERLWQEQTDRITKLAHESLAEQPRPKDQKDPTHSSNFGVKLQEKMRATGVECHVMYPGATNLPQPNPVEFLIARLKTEKIKSDVYK